MSLVDWPGKKIGRMWLWGFVAQAAAFGVLFVLGRSTASPEPPIFAEMRAYDDSVERGLLPPPHELTKAEKAVFVQRLHDSLGITLRHHGDTISVEGAPPALDSLVARGVTGLQHVSEVAALTVAAICLPIPTVLLFVTLTWAVVRLTARRQVTDPAV